MHRVALLVGTMTGTAELVAGEVELILQSAGFDVSVDLMDHLDASVFTRDRLYLICTSTYGSGDVPDNAQALLADLEVNRPNLSHVAFGLMALGDSTYQATFCHGGLRFDTLLRDLGATRLGIRCCTMRPPERCPKTSPLIGRRVGSPTKSRTWQRSPNGAGSADFGRRPCITRRWT